MMALEGSFNLPTDLRQPALRHVDWLQQQDSAHTDIGTEHMPTPTPMPAENHYVDNPQPNTASKAPCKEWL
jgi:hypothetical protein